MGKTTCARLLAKALNCERGLGCGAIEPCASCAQVTAGASAAVIEIDGASNTGVDHVRDLRESARYQPPSGRYKIFIVDEVHMLSQAAFNALLKLLEEPPPHVKFIFATTEPHKLPATMLSRCQRFDFRRVARAALADHLVAVAAKESVRIGRDVCLTLAEEADGSVRDALSLLDRAIGCAGDGPVTSEVLVAMGMLDRQVPTALLAAILARDAAALLAAVHHVDAQGYDFAEVLRLLLVRMRDAALAATLAADHPSLGELAREERAALAEVGRQRSQEDWQRLFEKLASVAEAVARSPVPKATCELGLLRLLQVVPAAGIGALLARVDTLIASLPASEAASDAGEPSVAPLRIGTSHLAKGPQMTLASELDVDVPAGEPARPAGRAQAATASAQQGAAATAATDVKNDWRAFVAHVRRKQPSLASLLEHAHVLTFRAGQIKVAFAPSSFSYETLTSPERRRWLGDAWAEVCGQASDFSVVPHTAATAAGETLASERVREADAAWAAIEQEARAHPHVQLAKQLLGGELTSVEPHDKAP